jgi:hypothetical protein
VPQKLPDFAFFESARTLLSNQNIAKRYFRPRKNALLTEEAKRWKIEMKESKAAIFV